MTGVLYIDTIDAFERWGVFVTEGGYKDLVTFPKLKEVDSVDWQEEDGIEPDLSAPKLESSEMSISFCSTDTVKKQEFIDAITDGSYHTFDFRELGVTRSLRLVSAPTPDQLYEFETFTLTFALDGSPLSGYTYVAPSSSLPLSTDCIDDIDFATYGMRLLEGSRAEVERTPDTKENQIFKSKYSDGATYDGATVTYKAKDVKLSILMRTATTTAFWRNWNALLYNLTQADDRELLFNSESYEFYYKSCSTKEFALVSGCVWWKFDLTICMYNYRAEIFDLLAHEDNSLVLCEDNYFVEM